MRGLFIFIDYIWWYDESMKYQRFNIPPEVDVYQPGQVEEYAAAAELEYTDTLPYHNWNHAQAVIAGVEIIADKLSAQNVKIARNTLKIAAAWHDAGYHRNHAELGFNTKEEYSAALLMDYLEDKPVTDIQKQLMRTAIIATWHLHPQQRTPNELILHRADIANIGGPTDVFIENNLLLWQESKVQGHRYSWDQHIGQSSAFVQLVIAEHAHESVLQNLDRDDTTIDVNREPFEQAALENLIALNKTETP